MHCIRKLFTVDIGGGIMSARQVRIYEETMHCVRKLFTVDIGGHHECTQFER